MNRKALMMYPKEYVESLWGTVNKDGSISVKEFHPVQHTATKASVDFDGKEMTFGEKYGGLVRLGTIHSHPDQGDECSPSELDWKSSNDHKELVTGIIAVPSRAERKKGSRSRAQFYMARAMGKVVRT